MTSRDARIAVEVAIAVRGARERGLDFQRSNREPTSGAGGISR
jgi:hypothetical protein